jgi:hypothetical protein
MDISKLTTALGAYARANSKEIRAMIYNVDSPLFKYTKTITKVKGEFPAINSITSNVIQGFIAQWNELGQTKIRPNILKAYHQKVNFPIIPAEIEASWLGEMNEEDLNNKDKSITKYIMEKELKPKVQDDVRHLSVNGEYDAGDLETFGKSMNGVIAILEAGVADMNNPMFRIPLAVMTNTNAVDTVMNFEKSIPKKFRRKVKAIFISTSDLELYKEDYMESKATVVWATEENTVKTPLHNIPLIGVDEMPAGSPLWCTVEDNLLKLVDNFNAPAITDIQVLDYKVKIFMEFHLGIGFWTNQLVFVGMQGGSGTGLISGENTLYYN